MVLITEEALGKLRKFAIPLIILDDARQHGEKIEIILKKEANLFVDYLKKTDDNKDILSYVMPATDMLLESDQKGFRSRLIPNILLEIPKKEFTLEQTRFFVKTYLSAFYSAFQRGNLSENPNTLEKLTCDLQEEKMAWALGNFFVDQQKYLTEETS